MIRNLSGVIKYCCEDISLVENYDICISSDEIYDCHHRLETHNSDGERRTVDLSVRELKALNMYFNRPASELIFLKHGEHSKLHNKGKHASEETKKKLSESHKGQIAWNKGVPQDDEAKRKNQLNHLGKKHSQETIAKMKQKTVSDETKEKLRLWYKNNHPDNGCKGKHWKVENGKRVWY